MRKALRPGLLASLGPGLLWAATAIGVSHLVQSTRAGALGGLSLAGVVLAALVLKYPFFEFGPRFAAATGRSLVEGYASVGRWALWTYLGITVATAAIVQAAILLFTAAVLADATGLRWPLPAVAGIVYAGCAALVLVGRFATLDRVVKAIIVVLALSTLLAAGLATPALDVSSLGLLPRDAAGDAVPLAFVLALAGWMPSAIDISVWSSLWTLAKDRELGRRAAFRDVMLDFRIGYVGTGVIAFAFLLLGTVTMFQSGAAFSASGVAFAAEVVNLFAASIGEWTVPVIRAAVISTMFSTSLAVVDGFPRAIDRTVAVLRGAGAGDGPVESRPVYVGSLLALAVATSLIHLAFLGGLTSLVDFATIVAFLTAPLLGYLNLRAVRLPDVPEVCRPGGGLIALSWIGLFVLGGFALAFLGSRLAT